MTGETGKPRKEQWCDEWMYWLDVLSQVNSKHRTPVNSKVKCACLDDCVTKDPSLWHGSSGNA